MGLRQIIKIEEELCDGCGQCVTACAEGAIRITEGKARLVSDTYCDGLGACLGDCPQGALSIVEREAGTFDDVAVQRHLATLGAAQAGASAAGVRRPHGRPSSAPQGASTRAGDSRSAGSWAHHGGCPGSALRTLQPEPASAPPACPSPSTGGAPGEGGSLHPTPGSLDPAASVQSASRLGHWPVQLCLVPPSAPFLRGADLLVCADCVPFTVSDFHSRYLAGRAVLVGCPKLDDLPFYLEKLKAVFAQAGPARITVLRMEVPCCGGIAQAAIEARNQVAPRIELAVHIIGVQGGIREERVVSAPAVG